MNTLRNTFLFLNHNLLSGVNIRYGEHFFMQTRFFLFNIQIFLSFFKKCNSISLTIWNQITKKWVRSFFVYVISFQSIGDHVSPHYPVFFFFCYIFNPSRSIVFCVRSTVHRQKSLK